jgi:anti-sigma regulatory factor (Ser/Thr protein kinase)/HAMP domain-containing protein
MRFTPSRWRLTTSLTLTVAVLFLTVMGFTYLTYRDLTAEREAAEIENAVAISRTVAAQIDGFVLDLEGTTLAAALALGNEPGLSHQRTGPYLKAIRDNYTTLRALFLTDLAGRVIASASGEGIGLDLSQRPYMQRLRAGAVTTWSRGIKGIASGQTTVAFGRRVVDAVGRTRAFLIVAFYPPSLMAKLRATLPADAMVTLLDDQGNVLYSTHFPERGPVPDLSELPTVQEVLTGRPVRITRDAAPFSSTEAFGAMVPVTRTRWAVVLTRPLAPLQVRLRDPVLEQVIGISAVMLLALSLFVVISRWLIRPLDGLAKTAASIARGDTPRIIRAGGPAEVAQLAEGMAVMAQAVDERERALQFINEASRQLASTLDYEATLRSVARLAVDRIADWCVVDVVDDDGRLRRLGVAHVDPAKVAMASELEQRYPTDPNAPRGIYQVLRTGQAELFEDISDEMLGRVARDPEHLRILRELGLRSAMIVPLTVRGRTVGVITFVTAESGRRYTARDLEVAEALARRTAVAIDNARMYARERGIAETLQRSLLPERLPEIPGVRTAARYLPGAAEAIGGDWYDLFVLPGGRVGLVMGDVAGRGVPVASLMGQLRNSLRAYAVDGYPPAEVVARLNDLIEPGNMATLVYLVLDPVTWTVTYSNAGHLPPLVASPDGAVQFLEGGALPLGNTLATLRHEGTTQLAPGSTIVLYTDGLVEERGVPIDAGLTRLQQTVSGTGDEDLEIMLERILSTVPGQPALNDDVALLAVRVSAIEAEQVTFRLPAVPASLATLRQSVRRWLLGVGAGEADAHEIVVACSEAASNVIEHAYGLDGGMVELSAGRQDGRVVIQVRDWGRWREERGSNRGRGLAMIRALMDEVEIKPGDDGTLLEMRRRLRRE